MASYARDLRLLISNFTDPLSLSLVLFNLPLIKLRSFPLIYLSSFSSFLSLAYHSSVSLIISLFFCRPFATTENDFLSFYLSVHLEQPAIFGSRYRFTLEIGPVLVTEALERFVCSESEL